MKIGILTQPLHNNYGGVMQAFALQTVLKRMGHQPINLSRKYYDKLSYRRYILNVGSFLKCLFRIYILHDNRWVLMNPFKEGYCPHKCKPAVTKEALSCFVKSHIEQSSNVYSSKVLYSIVDELSLDAIVVGSDQVWREDYSPCITDYFLHFLPKDNRLKKIAYAASFGTDLLNISSENLSACQEGIKQFQAISVRENSGLDILAEQFGREAIQVLDPTLLLSMQDYDKLIAEECIPSSSTGVVSYVLDDTSYKTDILQAVQQYFISSQVTRLKMHPLFEPDDCIIPTMGQWLQSIRDAEFVITDSFHGCVFSIIFRKPFIAIGNEFRGLDRFRTLLGDFGLMNRLVLSFDDFKNKESELISSIDYTEVYIKYEAMRSMSITWLEKHLA